MNEPEVNDPYRWAGIQARAAAAIREVAPHNTIIATGPNWSGIADLLTQHPLPDGNVIYNFHFYEPHEFTHQGASWGGACWIYTHDIPCPATENSMDDLAQAGSGCARPLRLRALLARPLGCASHPAADGCRSRVGQEPTACPSSAMSSASTGASRLTGLAHGLDPRRAHGT